MADAPRANVPAPIDRAAVERVLARAVELQASGSGDTTGQLSEAQLIDLAKEVGLDQMHLRQALAEERTRVMVPDEAGLLARMYGGSVASAQRTVRGTPAEVLRALDDWMQRQEGLCPQRYFSTERIIWESRRGVIGAVRRAVSGRGHSLVRATDVAATVIPVDGNRVLVRLDARLGGFRSVMAQQNAILAGVGLLVTGALTATVLPALVIVAPALLVGPTAFAQARGMHRRTVEHAQMALEQVLDRLERGEAGKPPTIFTMLAAAAIGRG